MTNFFATLSLILKFWNEAVVFVQSLNQAIEDKKIQDAEELRALLKSATNDEQRRLIVRKLVSF